VNTSTRSATISALLVLAGLVAAIMVAVFAAGPDSVPVLAVCVLLAAGLIALTVWGVVKEIKAHKLWANHNVKLPWFWRHVSRRQWLMTLVPLTVLSIATGSVASVHALAATGTPPQAVSTAPGLPVTPPVRPTDSPVGSPTESPTGSPTDTPSDSSSPAPDPGATTYLDQVQTVDGSDNAGPVTFSSQQYPRSVSLYCYAATQTYLQWNVAGNSTFSTTAGIADDAQDAYGIIAEFTFYDQDGHQLTPKPVDVSVGHPVPVRIDLSRVVNLRVTCAARDATTSEERSVTASLGDPITIAS
jgi:hypothetical protein